MIKSCKNDDVPSACRNHIGFGSTFKCTIAKAQRSHYHWWFHVINLEKLDVMKERGSCLENMAGFGISGMRIGFSCGNPGMTLCGLKSKVLLTAAAELRLLRCHAIIAKLPKSPGTIVSTSKDFCSFDGSGRASDLNVQTELQNSQKSFVASRMRPPILDEVNERHQIWQDTKTKMKSKLIQVLGM